MATPIRLASSCASTATPALADWLHAGGAHLSPSVVIDCGARRGLRATAPIREGEVVASVPHSLLLTHALAAELSPDLAHLGGTNLVALSLLRALREPASRYHAYALSLPPKTSSTLAWSADELAELQASDLAEHARSRAAAVERHHAALSPLLRSPGLPPATAADLSWALSIVWSRSHTVRLPDGSRGGALAPLIDLCNYAAEPTLNGALTEGDALVLRATRPLAAGEEATVPYGGGGGLLPNARLLMDYGFCVDGFNTADDVALPLPTPPDGPRADALRRLRLLPAPPPRLVAAANAPLPPEALVYARLATVQPPSAAAAEAARAAADVDAFAREAFADAATRRFLREAAAARLAEYATSAAEDGATLDALRAAAGDEPEAEPARRRRCAIALRRQEKLILERWVAELGREAAAGPPRDEL